MTAGSAPPGEPAPQRRHRQPELRVINSIHDQFQLESSSHFDLLPHEQQQQRRYKIDTYMFIPVSIGVNHENYNKASFFRHLTSHYRIRTPKFRDWLDSDPESLRLDAAERYFAAHLSTHERSRLGPLVIQETKLFTSFIHTRIKKLLKYLRRCVGGRTEQVAGKLEDLRQRLEKVVGLIATFRQSYLRRLREQPILVEREVRQAFLLADEYISYRLEFILIRIGQSVKDLPEDPGVKALAEELLQREVEYREEHDMLCLHQSADEPRTLELYTYRLGLLKKYIAEVLYLRVTSARMDDIYRNGLAIIVAGLAATFVLLARHQRLDYFRGSDWQIRVSVLLVLAVAGYIFKDRIRALGREFFSQRLKHRLPDLRIRLAYPYVDQAAEQRTVELGIAQEFVRYQAESMLAPEILYLRNIDQQGDIEPARNEVVLHYSRQLDFRLRAAHAGSDFRYIKQVLRFDFSAFLSKLDDPAMMIHYYDQKQGPRVAQAPKVYHVNMLFRYQTVSAGAAGDQTRVDYERIRVILNKRGIVRMETVVPAGELAYPPGGA